MPARGGAALNLTNTPDVDEFDPAWSDDGRRLAFASDAARSDDAPDNYDVFVLDLTRPGAQPVPVTTNGSWDDSPAWDARGRGLYFRSNRGGAWNVWRVEVK
jgi:Tol biopolymer transport system component